MLNRSASLAMSTCILKALPGKFDIKRHSPSILYVSLAVPWVGLWSVIVVFPGHTHLMFSIFLIFHITLVNVYVELVVFTRFAGTS